MQEGRINRAPDQMRFEMAETMNGGADDSEKNNLIGFTIGIGERRGGWGEGKGGEGRGGEWEG